MAVARRTVLSSDKFSADLLRLRLRSSASWVSLPNHESMLLVMNCADTPKRNTPGSTATKVNMPASRRAICEPNMPRRLSRIKSHA